MMKNYEKANRFMMGLKNSVNRLVADSFTIDKLADMENQEFEDYKAIAKSYQEFSDLALDMVAQMDEQTQMLDDLQKQMKLLAIK